MELTQDQANAETTLLQFFDSTQKYHVLQGHAGTGKTTLVRSLVESFKLKEELYKLTNSNYKPKQYCFTATTNKAAEALSQATQEQATTVHSLLGIAVRTDFTTGDNYSFRKRDAETLSNSIIIIDECSYIDDRLLTLIDQGTDATCKVLFMGDSAQLTPVKSELTPVFSKNFPTVSLSQIVRQEATNPIVDACARLRKTIHEHVGFPKIKLCSEIVQMSVEDFEKEIITEFSRDDWQQGDSKILAWTNKSVQKYNGLLFKHINQRSSFKAGDYVINNHFVAGLKTDGEYQIQHIRAVNQPTSGSSVEISEAKSLLFLPSNPKDYEKFKKAALKAGDASLVKEIVETWVDLRPAYACTVNKSQGSTYKKVYIDLNDLGKCRDALQLARLLYVAMSRAKYQVILVGNI